MTTNERELAQLERTGEEDQAELALVVVEVVARDEQGRISQFRGFREATAEDVAKLGGALP
jgi:glycine cleavage system regulatory protein